MQHTLHTNESIQVDMLNPLKSTLKNSFPAKDGWKLYNRYNWSSKVYDYVLQKEENNSIYRILVEINFGDQVTACEMDKLASLSSRLNTSDIAAMRTVLVVHDKVEIEKIPAGIEIMDISTLFSNGIMNINSGMNSKMVA
jgi:hypothetical protein